MKPRNATGLEVIFVLIAFAVIMTLSVAVLGIPIQLGLLAIWFLIIGVGLRLNYAYKDLQNAIFKGINSGFEPIFIIIVVGALIGTWVAGGVVPSIIFYGLQIIHPSVFLVASVIICAITALATGTSFGTIATAGIAMMGIGASLGAPLPLVAGAVIAGALFGDQISPLSDVTNMTAALAKVDLIELIKKGMLPVAIPALIITLILFGIAGIFLVDTNGSTARIESVSNSLDQLFNIQWYLLIPAAIVIILLIMKKPAVPVISFGALLGIVWATLFGGMPLIDAIETAYDGFEMDSGIDFIDSLLNAGGISSMFDTALIMMLALGIGGLFDHLGFFNTFTGILDKWVRNSNGKLSISTVVASFLGNLFASAALMSIVTGAKTTEALYDERNIDRRVLGRNIEVGGAGTTSMVPWTDGASYYAAVLGVSTMTYLPFMWYSFLMIIITIFYSFMGWFACETERKDNNDKSQISIQNRTYKSGS